MGGKVVRLRCRHGGKGRWMSGDISKSNKSWIGLAWRQQGAVDLSPHTWEEWVCLSGLEEHPNMKADLCWRRSQERRRGYHCALVEESGATTERWIGA